MNTSIHSILSLAETLINIPSVSGREHEVVGYVRKHMQQRGWTVESFPVCDGRENLFVSFGSPKIVFTTHLDVVPAPPATMKAKVIDGVLYGRGACDAKGIASTMIHVAAALRERQYSDFGLLFVVGEEDDGCGAMQAARDLAGRGIRYIVNGEPTRGKLMSGHKGQLDLDIVFRGKACHSGFPEHGEDANLAMLDCIQRLRDLKLPCDPILEATLVNFGVIQGGVAANVISPEAMVRCFLRISVPSSTLKPLIWDAIGTKGETYERAVAEPITPRTLPGFETDVAAFFTDIPYFMPLGVEALLYGPGDILLAHTDHEHVKETELADAMQGYLTIFQQLTAE